MKKWSVLMAGLLLAACATTVTAVPSVTCNGDKDCKYKWGRALAWVTDHSDYRIDQANDQLIQTTGPDKNSPKRAITIVRVPVQDGSERFKFQTACDNMFGCTKAHNDMEEQFRMFVMEGR